MEYIWLLQFSIIESQNNGDDTIIAGQVIMIFMINWIIVHPYHQTLRDAKTYVLS